MPGAPTLSPGRIGSTIILKFCPRPGIPQGMSFSSSDSGSQQAIFIGDVFHHLLQVYYPHWNFPKNSDLEQARASRRMVLDLCASTGALVLPCHVGAPFAGYVDAVADGFKPRFG